VSDLDGSVLLVGVLIAFAGVLRGLQWWLARDRGLTRTQQQCSPRPTSRASHPTTTVPAQYQPNTVVSSTPTGNSAKR
jgi:hypothetical protein